MVTKSIDESAPIAVLATDAPVIGIPIEAFSDLYAYINKTLGYVPNTYTSPSGDNYYFDGNCSSMNADLQKLGSFSINLNDNYNFSMPFTGLTFD